MIKNVFALFIAGVMAAYSVYPVLAIPGDVDLSGIVDVEDASLVLQYVLDKNSVELSEEGLLNANVKNRENGEVTAVDAALILKKALNKDFILPVEMEESTEVDTKNTTEVITENTTESITENTTKNIIEDTTESITENTTEVITENTTESVTENQGKSVIWEIDDDRFDIIGEKDSSTLIDGLTINATADKKVNICVFEKEFNGKTYSRCIDLCGGGSVRSRSVSFNADGNCEIKVIAASGGEDKRILRLADKNGDKISENAVSSYLSEVSYNYTGNGERLYLWSAASGIKIYRIEIVYSGGDTSQTETTTESTTENTTKSDTETTTWSDNINEENKERFTKVEEMISQLMVNNVDKNGNVTYKDISWNVEKSGRNIWHYASGAMIKAFLDIYERTGDNTYYDYAKKHMDFFISDSGDIIHYSGENSVYTENNYILDDINPGKPLFYFYEKTGETKYKTAIDKLQNQLVNQPRTSYNVKGNFWHKKRYTQQIWLDGLYMAQPFYMEYGNKFNDLKVCEDSYSQFINVYNNMKDPKTGLYYHGYDDAYNKSGKQSWSSSETGLSKSFWLRAIGWYAMSLVDTIEKMPDSMTEEKQRLIEIYKEYADALIKYQDPATGMWYQVVDRGGESGNYLETSGTLAVSYSIMKAARLGYIDESYFKYGEKAFDGVCDKYLNDKNGNMTLTNLCLVAGLDDNRDGTYEYYIGTTKADNDAKGLAPLLFAYNEVRYKYDNAK